MDYRARYPAPLRYLSAGIDGLLAIGGLAIVVIVFVNAVLRGTAGFDLAWSLEVVGFLLLWLTFLGCAAACARGAHMRVTEIVAQLVPVKLQRPLAVAIDGIVVVLLCSMIVQGTNISLHTWAQLTTVLYWPVGLHYASMPAGMAATLLFHLFNFVIDLRDHKARAKDAAGRDWEDFE
ncbi:MAG: hypothetical protein Tsb0032_05810 [Kiloniellaceae bacterium]